MKRMTSMPNDKPEGLHVAMIMDGNGRWATRRGLPRISGHRAGVITVRRIVERAASLGIRRLTLYAFSSDNWRRPAFEVEGIFRLLRIFLRLEAEKLSKHGIRFQAIGRRDRLPQSVLQDIERAEAATLPGRHLHLCIALDYSSRDAISSALAREASVLDAKDGLVGDIVRTTLTQALDGDGGEVDLLIRTGGEKRLSDFLLWESAYAELFFTDRMWPEFDEAELDRALEEFGKRDRRYGAVPLPRDTDCLDALTSNR